jgi:hypothetical protein
MCIKSLLKPSEDPCCICFEHKKSYHLECIYCNSCKICSNCISSFREYDSYKCPICRQTNWEKVTINTCKILPNNLINSEKLDRVKKLYEKSPINSSCLYRYYRQFRIINARISMILIYLGLTYMIGLFLTMFTFPSILTNNNYVLIAIVPLLVGAMVINLIICCCCKCDYSDIKKTIC